jgi:hypothetical protein
MVPTTPIQSTSSFTYLAYQLCYGASSLRSEVVRITTSFLSRSALVLLTRTPNPAFLPEVRYAFNEYFVFDMNVPAVLTAFYLVYYLILEPIAAVRLPCCNHARRLTPALAVIRATDGIDIIDCDSIRIPS